MESVLAALRPPARLNPSIPVFPGWLPFLGHIHHALFWPERFYRRLAAMDTDLVWLQLQPDHWIVQNMNPESYTILRSKCSNAHYSGFMKLLLGRSLLTQDGAAHRSQRNAMNAPFTPHGIDVLGTSQIMKETVEGHVHALIDRPDFNALDETRTIALDIIFRILGIDRSDLTAWRRHYQNILMAAFPVDWQIPGFPGWWAARSRAWVSARIQTRIQEIRNNPQMGGMLAEMVRGWDNREGEREDDEVLIDNVLLLALAGHETTASTMCWMTAYLADDPASWARAREEVARNPATPSSPKELARFPFIESLFRESLRLHPPVTMVSRTLIASVEISGKTLPAGLWISFPINLWQRDPRRFQDPNTFNPDRWRDQPRRPNPLDNIGFAFGPHFCLGYHVALLEGVQYGVALVNALSARNKRLQLVKGFPRTSHLVGIAQPSRSQCLLRIVDA